MIKTFFLLTFFSLSCMGCISSFFPPPSPLQKPSIAPIAPLSTSAIPREKTPQRLSLRLKQELDELTEQSQNRQKDVREKIKKQLKTSTIKKPKNQTILDDKHEAPSLLLNRFKTEKKHQAAFLKHEHIAEQLKKVLDIKRKKLLASQVCSHLEDKQRHQLALNNDQKQAAAECLLSKELNNLSVKPYTKKIIKERIKKEQKEVRE